MYRRDLSLFKRGLIRWNEWREENPKIEPDLSGIDRSGQDHSGFNLSLANLRGANFSRTDLSAANLREANLSRADLCRANLREANLKEADLSEADLSGADLRGASLIGITFNGANLSGANLTEIYLSRTNLSGVNFNRVNLKGADLSGSDLTEANLSGANLSGANLRNAKLIKANLNGADLNETDLEGSNLSRSILKGSDLGRAILNNTILRSADLSLADLSIADLSEAILDSANLSGSDLSKADLSRTQALGTNFSFAKLTGACLENWKIDNTTNIDGVICDYVYQRCKEKERYPLSGNFAPGEFTRLFQKSLETVDLIFRNGIDWDAFAYSFKKVEVENSGAQLDVQSIEKKGDSILLVRVGVSPDADKVKIHSEFMQGYELAHKALEAQYQARLEDKDKIINQLLASINQLSGTPKKVSNYYLNQSQIAGGIVDAETVQSQQIGGDIHNTDNQDRSD